jgi:hypothetical protein
VAVTLGLGDNIYSGVFFSGLSFSPFMILSAHRTFKPC